MYNIKIEQSRVHYKILFRSCHFILESIGKVHLDFHCSNVLKGKFTMLKNAYVDYNLQISEDICIIMNISFKSDS